MSESNSIDNIQFLSTSDNSNESENEEENQLLCSTLLETIKSNQQKNQIDLSLIFCLDELKNVERKDHPTSSNGLYVVEKLNNGKNNRKHLINMN